MTMSSKTCLLALLVGASPCAAIRENSFDMQTLLSSEEGAALEESDLSQEEQDELAEDIGPAFRTCPKGMERESIKGEPTHCVYKLPELYSPSSPSLGKYFQEGLNKPTTLRYDKNSEALNMTLLFGEEFVKAWSDNATMMRILNEFAEAEFEHNPEMKSKFEGWITEVKESHFSDGHGDLLSGVHGVESDMFAAFFIIEHIAEHAVVEGFVHLLHMVTDAGANSIIYGEAFFAKYTGFHMVQAAAHTTHFLHMFLHYVMTPYLIERTLNLIFVRTQDSWLTKESHAEDFVNRLVYRSECVKDRLQITDESHNPFDIKNIQPVFENVCGHNQTLLLSTIMTRTEKVFEHIFDKLVSIGKCMNPGNNPGFIFASKNRYQAKVYCIERMYRVLRENRGKPGQLWTALIYMTTVMAETDELLVNNHYGHIMGDKFGVEAPDLNKWSELKDLKEVEPKEVPMGKKFGSCFMILATHRAYETSLSALAESITLWTRTFARRLIAANVRGTWWPCARVFEREGHDNEHKPSVGGFCKNENNLWLPEQRIAEQVACSTPLNYPQWMCHKRNWWLIRAKEDRMWCRTAGTFEGFNYWYFGEDLSKCGCSCCKRANAYKSLWPELEAGGH